MPLTHEEINQVEFLEQTVIEKVQDIKETFLGSDGMDSILLSCRINDDGSVTTQIASQIEGDVVISINVTLEDTNQKIAATVGIALEDHYLSGDNTCNITL